MSWGVDCYSKLLAWQSVRRGCPDSLWWGSGTAAWSSPVPGGFAVGVFAGGVAGAEQGGSLAAAEAAGADLMPPEVVAAVEDMIVE